MGEIQVRIHGNRLSSYCSMVQCALLLKGVPYKVVEEDLFNKTPVLVELNPVHKKVPVLVIDGKPIAESLVILEYIEEEWKDREPQLLPTDPYAKAQVRFWANFIYEKIVPDLYAILLCWGEKQEKAAKELMEHLCTLEDGLKKAFPLESAFIIGEKPGLLDVIVGSLSSAFKALAVIAGKELHVREKTPFLSSCVAAFRDLDKVKDAIVDTNKLLNGMLAKRENARTAADA